MTGICLQISCSIIIERRLIPETDGTSTSARTTSILWGLSFSISHAFMPSDTAATVENKFIYHEEPEKKKEQCPAQTNKERSAKQRIIMQNYFNVRRISTEKRNGRVLLADKASWLSKICIWTKKRLVTQAIYWSTFINNLPECIITVFRLSWFATRKRSQLKSSSTKNYQK